MQYADLAEWQNDLLESEETEAGRAYWRQGGLEELLTLKLPFEQSNPGQPVTGLLDSRTAGDPGFAPQPLSIALDAELVDQIEQVARRYTVTPSVVLLAGWQLLLWRLINGNVANTESLVGVAYDGRKFDELRAALGLLAKYLPVRCAIDALTPAGDFLQQVDQAIQERYKWQEYFAWEQIPHRNGSQPQRAFLPFCFDYAEMPEAYQAGAVSFAIERQYTCIDRFKVRLTGQRNKCAPPRSGALGQWEALTVTFDYDAGLFRSNDIERLAEQYVTLLQNLVNTPERALGALSAVSEGEREALLVTFNQTAIDHGPFQPVHRRFEWQAERTPNATAVVAEGDSLTYAELNRRANQLAHYLRRLNIGGPLGVEGLVGLCAERSVDLLVGMLGILKAGGAYVPLDPLLPTERLAAMLADAQPRVLLTQSHLLAQLPQSNAEAICLDGDWSLVGEENEANPTSPVAPDNLVYVLFTSGSTGRPKGVGVTHGNLTNYVQAVARRLALPAGASYATVSTFAADLGNTAIFPALCGGGTLHVVAQARLTDPAAFADYFDRHPIDCLKIVPSHLAALLQAEGARVLPRQRLVLGGEALRPALVAEVQRLAPELQVLNHYGPTETTVGVLTYAERTSSSRCASDPVVTAEAATVPLGRPLGNVQAYVLDAEMQPVTLWVAGELYIGGAQVARGYLHRPDLTAERFVPDPFSQTPGARLYRTGDLVRHLPEGAIAFLGRVDHQIKIRGFRIELGEIEAALRTLPGVQASVVDARADGGEPRLVAYVVVDKAAKLTVNELRRGLQTLLPDYMLPAAFVKLDAIPLTANGKVDRRALPAPEKARSSFAEAYVAPRTTVEEMVARIWAEVLGVAQVGVHDNFFALGGHSLMATQLIARARERCQVELPLRRLFDTPTVAGLAEYIASMPSSAGTPLLPPIARAPREGELPLSFAQQRLWFLDQLEPGSSSYNLFLSVQLQGQLDQAALEQAFTELVRRHEILRTTFLTIEGRPQQVISPASPVNLTVLDLRDLPVAARTTQARQLAAAEANRPFDLARGPLFRVTLLRLAEEETILLLTLHHIVSDGWSSGILVREVAALYTAFVQGAPLPLPELPIQYADFAHWQRTWLQGEVLAQQLAYWKEKLSGELPVLELPTDRPRPAVQRFQGARQWLELGSNLSSALTALAQQSGVTPFMLLLAAFKVLLHRYSGQEDIIVGSPIANRTRTEIEGLIGFFVNTLVLRTDLAGNPSFQELVKRVREGILAATAHQEAPFERVVEEVQPERDLGRTPLFQVMFMLRNMPTQEVALPGVTLTPLQITGETAKFDLSLCVTTGSTDLVITAEYNTDLFDAATIERLLQHYRHLLEAIVAEPAQPIATLPLLQEDEERQLLHEWSQADIVYPVESLCLHQLFEAQVLHTPDAIAVACDGHTWSYDELNARANQLAHYLQGLGVGGATGAETLVGVCLERSLDLMVGLLGVLKAGGAYVPLEPNYPPDRLAFMLADAQPRVLLTQAGLLAQLPATDTEVICLDRDWSQIAPYPTANVDSGVGLEHLAYLIYTSGSTGRPKGAMITHGGLTNYLHWCLVAYPVKGGRGSLVHSTIAFDATITALFAPLLVGRTVELLPETDDIQALAAALAHKGNLSLLKITPAHLTILGQQLTPTEMEMATRSLVIGGENLTAEQIAIWRSQAPHTRIYNEYGPTENVVGCIVYEVTPAWDGNGSVPIGRPIPNTQMYVLDRHLNPAPVGVPGELYLGGVGVARGYLHRPDTTAEKFVPDPFSQTPGARLYRTGDLVRYRAAPNGVPNLEFLGRLDDQVKIRGYRVELGEIEAVLAQHPAVRETVVVARADELGRKRLVAYVVINEKVTRWQGDKVNGTGNVTLSPPHPVTLSELRAFLSEKLPDYMIPAAFVMLDALPLTPNGKVNRKALPAPDTTRPELAEAFAPPSTPVEAQLAAIWMAVLGLEQVGIHDNFFALGGDSILSIQIVARANTAGLRLTPKQLFQHQTIAKLATVVSTAPLIQAEQGLVTGPVPLTPIQQWFFARQGAPASTPHHWNQAVLLEARKALQPTLLEQAVQQLLAHHDALRLRFTPTTLGWRQVNQGIENAAPFTYIDLSHLPSPARRAALEARAAELQAGLNLAQGPLMQMALFHYGEQEPQRLLVIIHHLVVDGVSWRILLEDLVMVYEQLSRGGPVTLPPGQAARQVQLPPKTTSFKQWAEQLTAYAHSTDGMAALKAELSYWLAGARAERVALPVDFAASRDANTEASTRTVTVALSGADTTALLQAVPAVYHTQINDLLLTALVQTLAPWLATDALLIDLEGHGREDLFADVDISRTVGWFTVLYPVRLELDGHGDPGAALMSIKEQLRAIPNRGLGYGLLRYLVADDEIAEQLCGLPQAEVSFNYFGQLDQALPASAPFAPAKESAGPLRSAGGRRNYLISITSSVSAGQLHVVWAYSENCHRRATIEHLAATYIETLQALIAHCLSPEAGGFTPSDFPLAQVDQDELAVALAEVEFE